MLIMVLMRKKVTPKHIGLGLVNLFNSAGHTIGMDTIRCMDTSIALMP